MKRLKDTLNAIKTIYAVTALFGIMPFKRNPFWSISYGITPLALLFFINLYGGSRYLPYVLIGGIITITVATTISLETDAAFLRIVLKLQAMYVASPVGPLTYSLGLAIGDFITGVPGILIFFILLHLYGYLNIVSGIVLLTSVGLTWALISALGFLISSFLNDIKDLWTYGPILAAILSFLPPVYYPIELITNPVLRMLVYIIPTTVPARIAQAAVGAASIDFFETMLMWVGLILYTLLINAMLVKYARWRQP
jgi:ABC-2 type transport system permease protein